MTASVLQRLNVLYMARFMADAVRRFPLPALLSVALTALVIMEIHGADIMRDEVLLRATTFCITGFVLTLGTALYREGHGTSAAVSWAAALAGLGALLLAFFYPVHLTAGHLFLSAAIGLFLLIAPFANRRVSGDNVWGFVYKSAIAVMFGGVSTLILAGGLSAILGSIQYLFEIKIDGKFYADIWSVGWCLFFPLYVLAGVPRELESDSGPCDIPAPVSFIANYLMVPMMLAYTGILYAYGIKIAFEWELPRGNLAYMVTGFGIVGILTHLAVYPMRERGTRLLRFYFKAFYVLLPVPLLLLAIGLWTRIAEYGVTEQRYAIGLCLAWLGGLVLLKAAFNKRVHIKHVPLLLCALCLIASFGPWSAQSVSLKSQYAKLEQHLTAAGVISADGKVQKATGDVTFENRRAISSIVEYFRDRRALDQLQGWISPFKIVLDSKTPGDDHPIEETLYCGKYEECQYQYVRAETIVEAWGIRYVSRWTQEDDNNSYIRIPAHDHSGILMVQGYDFALPNVWVTDRAAHKGTPFKHPRIADTSYAFYQTPDGDAVLEIFSKDKPYTRVTLPLKDAGAKIRAENASQLPDAKSAMAVIKADSHNMRAEFRIASLNYTTKPAEATTDKPAPAPESAEAAQTPRLESAAGTLLFTLR